MEDKKRIRKLEGEVRQLKQAVRWLAYEVANNNNWIGYANKEITTADFESNREGFKNRLATIIGKD